MKPDITNAIARALLLPVSVKWRAGALFIRQYGLLPANGRALCRHALGKKRAADAAEQAASRAGSFSVNFQPD